MMSLTPADDLSCDESKLLLMRSFLTMYLDPGPPPAPPEEPEVLSGKLGDEVSHIDLSVS